MHDYPSRVKRNAFLGRIYKKEEDRMFVVGRIIEHPNALHVLNAPSPKVTASLAVGSEINQYVKNHIDN